jgi:hypothetical protein
VVMTMMMTSRLAGIPSRSTTALPVFIYRTGLHIDIPCTSCLTTVVIGFHQQRRFRKRDLVMLNVLSILGTCQFTKFSTMSHQLV